MNKKILVASLVLAASLSAGVVSARENEIRGKESETRGRQAEIKAGLENGGQKNFMQKRLEFQDRKEKMDAQRCQDIADKIANRTGRYQNSGQMIEKVYGNMTNRLIRLLARLTSIPGVDTTKFAADLGKAGDPATAETLFGKIQKLKDDQALLMTSLDASKTLACGGLESEFKGKFDQARNVTATIKADRADIKKFFQTTLKTDLQAIRTQLAALKPATEDTKDTDETKTTTEATTPTITPTPTTTITPAL